jgi:DNA-directed RNA polymerase subunit RPC12/RpoP
MRESDEVQCSACGFKRRITRKQRSDWFDKKPEVYHCQRCGREHTSLLDAGLTRRFSRGLSKGIWLLVGLALASPVAAEPPRRAQERPTVLPWYVGPIGGWFAPQDVNVDVDVDVSVPPPEVTVIVIERAAPTPQPAREAPIRMGPIRNPWLRVLACRTRRRFCAENIALGRAEWNTRIDCNCDSDPTGRWVEP